ncbi:hypothetical protein PZ895_12570 [Mesorhizobium sp. YIM 152430]|uniref:hypothetical protein n=1 Tax=Mesorhizobium sp. YIM 152430 TaxID=3031761 RepID=UPI0023DB5415|nr:hypothetical protein [Mesorhizobium sp. YIM 152430]MDF1600595.1 hypothetical protein [Mesorhizobium sp. YIM 152430]
MDRLVTYLVRFVAILAGFVVACLAASLFLNLLFASTVVAVIPEFSEAARPTLFVTVPFFALIIANLSFGAFLLVAVAAELIGWRSWLAHALAGAPVALYAGWQMAAALDAPAAATDTGLMLLTLAAGLVGGIAYWAIAGRNAGMWRGDAGRAPS